MAQLSVEGRIIYDGSIAGGDTPPLVGVAGHLYIVYKNDAGVEYVIRSGPSPFDSQSMFFEMGTELDGSSDSRTYLNDQVDTPSDRGAVILATGEDATTVWGQLLQHAGAMQAANLPYDKFSHNSNTVVANLLKGSGFDIMLNLPEPSGFEGIPGWQYPGVQTVMTLDYHIQGDQRANSLFGGAGSQTFWGGGGSDLLLGGIDNDALYGESESDVLSGGLGNDVLSGGYGSDFLYGDGDNDLIYGDEGADTIDGGSGIDTLDYSMSTAGVRLVNGQTYGGFAEGDSIAGIEIVIGSNYADAFSGALVRFYGRGGNDLYLASQGGYFDGGDGIDIIDFTGTGVTTLGPDNSNALGVTFANVEEVVLDNSGKIFATGGYHMIGTEFADTFNMSNNWNATGNGGNDVFYISAGTGTAKGGAGNDTFVIKNVSTGSSRVIEGGDDYDILDFSLLPDIYLDLQNGMFRTNNNTSAYTLFTGIEESKYRPGQRIIISGSTGADIIESGYGNTDVYGNGGNDRIIANAPGTSVRYNKIDGGPGDDEIISGGTAWLNGGIGNDLITGSDENDLISGDGGNDVIFGRGGNDYVAYTNGFDSIDGGEGFDVLRMSGSIHDLTFNYLGGFDVEFAKSASDRALLSNIEHIHIDNIHGDFSVPMSSIYQALASEADGVMTGSELNLWLKGHGFSTNAPPPSFTWGASSSSLAAAEVGADSSNINEIDDTVSEAMSRHDDDEDFMAWYESVFQGSGPTLQDESVSYSGPALMPFRPYMDGWTALP